MNGLEMPVLKRLLDRLLTPDVARKLVDYRFDAQAQERIDALAASATKAN